MNTKAHILAILFLAFNVWTAPKLPLQKTPTGYSFEFSLPEWSVRLVDTMGFAASSGAHKETYSRIVSPEYDIPYSPVIGRPELPHRQFVMVVADTVRGPDITVSDIVEREVILDRPLYPAQRPLSKSRSGANLPFRLDSTYYKSDGENNPLARVFARFAIRDVPCARVYITPFSYNPRTRALRVITKATIRIETALKRRDALDSRVFEEMLRGVAVNYDDYYAPNLKNAKENYLIITANKFASALARFKTFRERRFNVKQVTYSETGGTLAKTVDFIKKEYQNPAAKPTYTLIVGTHVDIPGFIATYHDTDLDSMCTDISDRCYSSLDTTTWMPKVHVGRFPVSDTTELSNIVNKTIFMEENLNTLPKTAVLTGGAAMPGGKTPEGTIKYCTETYLDKEGWKTTKLFFNSNESLGKNDLIAAINKGPLYNTYSGHGEDSVWILDYDAGKLFEIPDVRALVNTAAYPFTYIFACFTGLYTNANKCISTVLVNHSRGPVTLWSCSSYTMWGPDDKLQRELFASIFKDRIGSVAASFNAAVVEVGYELYFREYNLFGDPALDVLHGAITPVQAPPQAAKHAVVSVSMTGAARVAVSIGIPGNYTLTIYALSGKKIRDIDRSFGAAGSHAISLRPFILSKGAYLLSLQGETGKTVKKTIVLQ